MDLDNVLSARLSRETQWLQIGTTGSVDRVTLEGATFVNPPVLADAEQQIAAGTNVLVAKLDSGIVVLGKIKPAMTGPVAPPAQPVWAAIPLLNGWVNFGGGFQAAQYRKVGDVVTLRGLITNGNAALGVPIWNIPVAHQPTARAVLATISAGAIARVDATPDGLLVSDSGVSAAWLSLEGLSWSVSA